VEIRQGVGAETSEVTSCPGKLTRASSLRYRTLRNGQDRDHTVRVADVEQHSFGNYTSHFARFQVNYEQCLLTLEFLWVCTLLLKARNDSALVIAEAHA
jgi:hypothetical protein